MALLKPGHRSFLEAVVPPSPPPAEALFAILRDGATAALRREAALDLIGVAGAEAVLADALVREPADMVRETIVIALVRTATPAAAAALAGLLDSEHVGLRNAAVEGLQQIGDAAHAYVTPLLASPDADVRIFAINVVQALRHREAAAWLCGLLTDEPDVNVGLAAVEALSAMGGPGDAPALQGFAARFPDEPFVGFAVTHACRRVMAGA